MKVVKFNPQPIKIIKTFPSLNVDNLPEAFFKYSELNHIQKVIPQILQPMLHEILNLAAPGFKYTSLDFKVQSLQKGQYPCTPGWHCDGDPNPDKDLHDRYLLLVSGGFCQTEFVNEPIDLILPDNHGDMPKLELLQIIQNQLKEKQFSTIQVPAWSLVEFDKMSLHRAVKSLENHQRVLFRLNQSDTIKPKVHNLKRRR